MRFKVANKGWSSFSFHRMDTGHDRERGSNTLRKPSKYEISTRPSGKGTIRPQLAVFTVWK
ncbi:MAG TPA: hypothetical protein PL002_16880, partial [Flavobacteriales bacterium]|nr:hypothetical protein [Flavobacteriales bacterium]